MFRFGCFVLAAISLRAQTIDLPKLAAEIRASYYHPDALSSLRCGVTFDWDGLLDSLKTAASESRMKVLNGASVTVRSERGQTTTVEIEWREGEPTNKAAIEQSFQQMLAGFFQIYWPFAGSGLTPSPGDKLEAQPMESGGYIVTSAADGNLKMTTEVDKERVPSKISLENPAFKASLAMRFSTIPGAARRLSELDVHEEVGTSIINARVTMDYQDVGSFHIPRHVHFDLGTIAVSFDLMNCSAQ